MRRIVVILAALVISACGKVNLSSDARQPIDGRVDAEAGIDGPPDAFVPLTSCKQLAMRAPTSPSGIYHLDPDGPAGPDTLFAVYCDMTMDGGGWTLAMTATVATNWGARTPGFTQPTSPTDATVNNTSLHYSVIADMGVTQMMIMAGDHLIKFYYPRPSTDFTSNYRELTERAAFDSLHSMVDAPHSGADRSGCGFTDDACTTSDFAIFKTADASCPHDATNSYPAWGDCPGGSTSPPAPIPNCWLYGGTAMTSVPMIGACPAGSQAPWASYTTVALTGMTTVWLR